MSTGGGSSTTTTNQANLPPEFKPYYERLFQNAEEAYGNVSQQPYGGPLQAPVDPFQQLAMQQKAQLGQAFQGLGQGAIGLGQSQLAGDWLNAGANPYLADTIQGALRPVAEQFSQNVLPQIRSQAVSQGAFGGSRQDLSEASAATAANQQMAELATRIAMQNYGAERAYMQQAPPLIGQGQQLMQLGPELLAQVGDIQRSFGQEEIDMAKGAWEAQQMAPFQGLFPLASIIQGGNLGTVGQQTVTGGPSQASMGILGALGGASAGANIGNIMYGDSAEGWQQWLPAALGGVAGAGAGAFGAGG